MRVRGDRILAVPLLEPKRLEELRRLSSEFLMAGAARSVDARAVDEHPDDAVRAGSRRLRSIGPH